MEDGLVQAGVAYQLRPGLHDQGPQRARCTLVGRHHRGGQGNLGAGVAVDGRLKAAAFGVVSRRACRIPYPPLSRAAPPQRTVAHSSGPALRLELRKKS
jgi:hypothetical protein